MFDSQICRASFYGRDENTVAMSHRSSEPSLKVSSSQRSRGWGASVRCKPHLQSQFPAWCFSESVPTPRAPPASAQLWASGLIYVDGLTLNHNVSSCWRCTLCRCQQETLTREELWISCQWLLLLGGQWSDWLSEVAGKGEWVVRVVLHPEVKSTCHLLWSVISSGQQASDSVHHSQETKFKGFEHIDPVIPQRRSQILAECGPVVHVSLLTDYKSCNSLQLQLFINTSHDLLESSFS